MYKIDTLNMQHEIEVFPKSKKNILDYYVYEFI